ncbi:MAG: beta-lactamase family protein [Carboxylicivirga sp.]|jgi:CubicO group peptidase (beta-lactamase class C family)|nr:beta-lactamase family protein [Carboxylicivirga sp.]
MNKKVLIIISIVICVFNGCEWEKEGVETIKKEQLDTLFTELYEQGKFNGNVLIAEEGKVIFEKSFGLADEKTKMKLNKETMFELASVSKQFTAMGVVQLKKEGKLSYNDEVYLYIPELENYRGVTIHDLLVHTSGLPDYMNLADIHWDKSKIATNVDMINLLEKYNPELDFEPGEKWCYGNTGYLILASIIERVSGKSFGEYLSEKIFTPLEMNNTLVYRRWFNPKKMKNYAQGYVFSEHLKSKVLPHEDCDLKTVYLDGIVGDGMVNSTVGDLLKWDRALYGNSLINEDDKKIVFSSHKLKDSTETKYGYGWKITDSKIYGRVISHGGGWAGYSTYIERHLDHDKTLIFLQNNATTKTEIPSRDVCKILYNQPLEKPIELERAILKQYAGVYLSDKEKVYKIDFKNNELMFIVNPEVELKLIPVSKNRFILDRAIPEVTFTFICNKNGDVEKCRFVQVEKNIDKLLTRKN